MIHGSISTNAFYMDDRGNIKLGKYALGCLIENERDEWFKYDIRSIAEVIISILTLKDSQSISKQQHIADIFQSSTKVDLSNLSLHLPRVTAVDVDHLLSTVENKCSEDLRHLLGQMLLANVSLAQILEHPLMKAAGGEAPSAPGGDALENDDSGEEEVSGAAESSDDNDNDNDNDEERPAPAKACN
jgi:hypothetical protein